MMEHFAKSLFWRIVSVGLVASLCYVGYSICRLANTPIAHAEGRIEVNLEQIGGAHCFGAIPVKITK